MVKEYILLELSSRSFVIAKQVIGSRGAEYNTVATCRSRNQAKNLIELLNKEEK